MDIVRPPEGGSTRLLGEAETPQPAISLDTRLSNMADRLDLICARGGEKTKMRTSCVEEMVHKDGKAPVMPLEAEWRKMAGTLIEEQLPVLRRFSLFPRLGPQYANTAPHPTNSSITICNNLWLHVQRYFMNKFTGTVMIKKSKGIATVTDITL